MDTKLFGWAGQRLFKAEVDLVVVEPGHCRIDALVLELFRKLGVVLGKEVGIGSIVVCDDDGIAVETNITFEAVKEISCEVFGIPTDDGLAEALTQHGDGCLCNERHSHLSIADIEVVGSCAAPAQSLVGVEELFAVPAFWVMLDGFVDGGRSGGAEESVQFVVVFVFSFALDGLPIGVLVLRNAFGTVRTVVGGITDPVSSKGLGGDGVEFGNGLLL